MNMGENINKKIPSNAVVAFNEFLKSFKESKSYVLSNETKLFSKDNIDATYRKFCSNSLDDNGKDKKFEDVIDAIKGGDDVERNTMIDIINHAVWLWCLPNSRKTKWISDASPKKKQGKKVKNQEEETLENENGRLKDELLNIKGVAGGGPGYVQYKTNGVRFVLFLFTQICPKQDSSKNDKNVATQEQTAEDSKNSSLTQIIATCEKTNKYDDNKYKLPDGVKNLFLYLCDQDKYEPIASTDDKKRIVKALWKITSKDTSDNNKSTIENLDETIREIKKEIIGDHSNNGFSFYNNSLPLLWKGESVTGLSLAQKLEYKKAMILYGPPGTGKTYTAMELAKEVILRHYMKQGTIDGIDALKNEAGLKERIAYLQFHINYNYEDFIAGQTIVDHTVKTKCGFIFDVIQQAKKKSDVPFVVILDEINRTDISRVFGELFTAIEKRGEDVQLTLPDEKGNGRLVLNVPDNIYFIGTMNEIDFSLERVDFALRRRFIWELHDYSEDALENIINARLEKNNHKENADAKESVDEQEIAQIDPFITCCTTLNKAIEDVLGKTYHIGHAFFAEISDIFCELVNNKEDDAWEKAKNILWQISIRPTLEAYCGTMDKSEKDEYLKESNGSYGKFYKAFFGKDTDVA